MMYVAIAYSLAISLNRFYEISKSVALGSPTTQEKCFGEAKSDRCQEGARKGNKFLIIKGIKGLKESKIKNIQDETKVLRRTEADQSESPVWSGLVRKQNSILEHREVYNRLRLLKENDKAKTSLFENEETSIQEEKKIKICDEVEVPGLKFSRDELLQRREDLLSREVRSWHADRKRGVTNREIRSLMGGL